jgi:hypothetical protein
MKLPISPKKYNLIIIGFISIIFFDMAKIHPSVIALGKNKGHAVTKLKVSEKQSKKIKPSATKGRLGKRVKLIRQVIG